MVSMARDCSQLVMSSVITWLMGSSARLEIMSERTEPAHFWR